MSINLVNIGNSANDGTGDDLREAFIKVNQSLQYLDSVAFQGGINLGSSGVDVYKSTQDNLLQFRRLVPGNNISLEQLENTIVVNSIMPESRFVITGDSGTLLAGAGINYNIIGADAISVEANENTKTITIRGNLNSDPAPSLSADLNANNLNISNVNTIFAEDAELTNIGGVDYYSRLGRYISGFDFGPLDQQSYSILDWVIKQIGVDFGTFTNPNTNADVDLGTII